MEGPETQPFAKKDESSYCFANAQYINIRMRKTINLGPQKTLGSFLSVSARLNLDFIKSITITSPSSH